MLLTNQQKDALTEVINIAFGRAAASLSELTEHRVDLSVPHIDIHQFRDLEKVLAGLSNDELVSVHQLFQGPVSGTAMLMLNYDGARILVEQLTGQSCAGQRLNSSEREVINEVGNILLNACMGTLGNILNTHISFAVPDLHLDELSNMLKTLVINREELKYVIAISMKFNLRGCEISGFLMIILGVTSLEKLLEAVSAM